MQTDGSPHGRQRTLAVVRIAILSALAVLIRRYLTPHLIGLNLGGCPLILSGLLLGPSAGACVGAISDVVGAYLLPTGAFNPVFTLTAALTAALPALLLQLLQGLDRKVNHTAGDARTEVPPLWKLLVAILVSQGLTKGLILPWFLTATTLHAASTAAFNTLALHFLCTECVHAPFYAVACRAVLRALARRRPARVAGRPVPVPARAQVAGNVPGKTPPAVYGRDR